MKLVYSAPALPEAHLIRCMLEASRIKAIVQGEMLAPDGTLPGRLDLAPTVWVLNDADYEPARCLIASVKHRGEANPSHCESCGYNLTGLSEPRCPECGTPFYRPSYWVCPKCGEENEEAFSICWKCSAPIGGDK